MEFIDVKRFSVYVRIIYHSEYITLLWIQWIPSTKNTPTSGLSSSMVFLTKKIE